METKFYKNIEFDSTKKVKIIQEELLKKHIAYCRKNSPYYRKIFREINLKNIGLDKLSFLPFADKALLEKHNDDFLGADPKDIVDIVLSSGTTGKPTKIFYTESDLNRLSYNEKQSFSSSGLNARDVVLLTCTLDRCFVAGLAYFLGVRSLGATAIRNGLNSLESHLEIIKRMQPSAIVGVPSFLKKLGVYLDGQGFEARKSGIKKLICIGEPLRNKDMEFLKLGEDLEEIWDAKAYSTYSSSEIISTFCECTAQAGGHLHPDLAIVEIVDSEGRNVSTGEIGEVVVTPLQVQGTPLVRFKTGDVSFLIDKPCSCGRKSLRLGPILGRKKQMMKVSGTSLYPQSIYSCLQEFSAISEYYIIATSDSELSDNIEIHVSVNDPALTTKLIQDKLKSRLRVTPKVYISDEEIIREQVYNPKSRKPIRFIDRR